MKLFITNKKSFDDTFDDLQLTKKIHKEAFNELNVSLDSINAIPLTLTPTYSQNGVCIFNFVNKKDDVFFYEFITTII